MTRRTALVSAAAAALVLAPTAAFAYDAPGFSSTVSDPTPAAGSTVVVTVDGDADTANKEVVLTVTSTPASLPNSAIQIAGTASTAKTADAQGLVAFDVTLSQPGTYSAVATVNGTPVSTFELPVVAGTPAAAAGTSAAAAAAAPSAAAPAASAARAGSTGKALADTGFDGADLAAGAGALVLAGAGAVLVAKRRQSAAV